MINYGKQTLSDTDIQAVVDVLNSDWITQGPKIPEFEKALAEYCNCKYAVAVNNGTAALHLANIVMGVTSDVGVLTSPITFLSTCNSVIMSGGQPFFADIDNESFTLDPNEVKKIIRSNSQIKGIIPVHLGGVIADLEKLHHIALENNLWIIEDACHAIGGEWNDRQGNLHRVGDCSFSDLTIFSFHPVKQMTTGEGGAILTNDYDIYKKLILLREHGMVKDPSNLIENHGSWYYEMNELGYNYRITDFQCALGIEQLKKNDKWVKIRSELVRRYNNALGSVDGVTSQKYLHKQSPSFHLYILQAENRAILFKYLKEKDIFCQVHYIPIHLQPYYRKNYHFQPGDFPISENYYDYAISLPLYPSLSFDEQDFIIQSVKEFYGYS